MQPPHLFRLPSARESGGTVFLEVMAVARPFNDIDSGGSAEVANDGIGF